MTQHPLIALSREELRGWIACTRHMDTLSVRLGAEERALVVMLELLDVAQALLDRQTPRPVTAERVAEWGARFEAAAQRAPNHEARPWYQPAGGNPLARFCGTLLGALRCWGLGEWQGMGVTSNEWEGERWAAILPTLDGPPEAVLALTMEALKTAMVVRKAEFASSRATTETGARDLAHDAQPSRGEGDNAAPTAPLAAAPTPEEHAQPGLADAVAESLAEQPPSAAEMNAALVAEEAAAASADAAPASTPSPQSATQDDSAARSDSPWTKARFALLDRLFPTIMRTDRILRELNALPGLPIPSEMALRVKAGKRGLHRRGEPIPPEYADAPISRTRKPQMADAPAAKPIVTTAPVELDDAEMAELRETFRKKEFGTRYLTEDQGFTPEQAERIITQLRAEAQQKRNAA